MAKTDSSIEDLVTTVSDLTQMISDRFDANDAESVQIRHDIKSLRDDHSARFKSLEAVVSEFSSKYDGSYADIVEIFNILAKIEKGMDLNKNEIMESKRRLEGLILWAERVGAQLDTPLNSKSL